MSPLLVVFVTLLLVLMLAATMALVADHLVRKRVEARLHESEQRFRQLFDQAVDGIFVADIDGRYTDVNGAACSMLGYAREEIVGRPIADLIPPEDVGRLAEAKQRLLGGGSEISQWRMRRRDGSWLSVEASARVLSDGRWYAFVRDITDRQRNEDDLAQARETDRLLRGELEAVARAATTVSEAVAAQADPSVSEVLYTFAFQAQLLTDAQQVAIRLGTDPGEPFDSWVSLGMSPDTIRAMGSGPGSLEAAGFLDVPIRYRGRTVGNLYLADKRGAPEFTDRDRRMVGMLASRAAVAIETARLYAGAAAQQSWLRSIIDQMPEGVILLGGSGEIEAMNRAVLALAADEAGSVDAEGNPALFDVRAPDGAPIPFREYLVVRALTHGEVSTDHEHLVRTRDGRVVTVLVSAAPVRDGEGRITGAMAVIRDVTVLKELERLREEWASVVAHDLRQPVAAIPLTAEALLRPGEGPQSERQRRALERIRSASGRLNRMIEDLLDASRIEAQRLSLEPRPVDVGVLLDSVIEGNADALAGYTVRVHAEGDEHIAFVDPDRIHQVLGNLLSNAAKYGTPGTEIRVDCLERGEGFEIVVTNQGPGIRPDEVPNLFNRFWRTREARADRTPGLGLGLYIARGLVEAHGGRMWADSVPGSSTSFHFTIPRSPWTGYTVGAAAHVPG